MLDSIKFLPENLQW